MSKSVFRARSRTQHLCTSAGTPMGRLGDSLDSEWQKKFSVVGGLTNVMYCNICNLSPFEKETVTHVLYRLGTDGF